jgi:hypothetical protein
VVGYLAIFLMAIVIIIAIGSLALVGTTAIAKVVERLRPRDDE